MFELCRYESMEADADASTAIEPPKTWEAHNIEPWLVAQVVHIYSAAITIIHVDVDLFSQGFDRFADCFLAPYLKADAKEQRGCRFPAQPHCRITAPRPIR